MAGSFCSRGMLGLQDWQGAFPPGLFTMKVSENQSFKVLFRCYDQRTPPLSLLNLKFLDFWHSEDWYSWCEMLIYPYLSVSLFSLIIIISVYFFPVIYLDVQQWRTANADSRTEQRGPVCSRPNAEIFLLVNQNLFSLFVFPVLFSFPLLRTELRANKTLGISWALLTHILERVVQLRITREEREPFLKPPAWMVIQFYPTGKGLLT